MAGKKGGNPRIETANQARRLNAAQRRLEKQVMQRDGGWADATPEELEEYARLARVKAAANDPPGAVEAEMPIDYDEQIEQLKRRGRMNAR